MTERLGAISKASIPAMTADSTVPLLPNEVDARLSPTPSASLLLRRSGRLVSKSKIYAGMTIQADSDSSYIDPLVISSGSDTSSSVDDVEVDTQEEDTSMVGHRKRAVVNEFQPVRPLKKVPVRAHELVNTLHDNVRIRLLRLPYTLPQLLEGNRFTAQVDGLPIVGDFKTDFVANNEIAKFFNKGLCIQQASQRS